MCIPMVLFCCVSSFHLQVGGPVWVWRVLQLNLPCLPACIGQSNNIVVIQVCMFVQALRPCNQPCNNKKHPCMLLLRILTCRLAAACGCGVCCCTCTATEPPLLTESIMLLLYTSLQVSGPVWVWRVLLYAHCN
jgi:hypothetical protein